MKEKLWKTIYNQIILCIRYLLQIISHSVFIVRPFLFKNYIGDLYKKK